MISAYVASIESFLKIIDFWFCKSVFDIATKWSQISSSRGTLLKTSSMNLLMIWILKQDSFSS